MSEHPVMLSLVYLGFADESFDEVDRYDLGLMTINSSNARDLTSQLDEVAHRAKRQFDFPDTPELHGYNIFHAEGEWAVMKVAPRARARLYKDVVEIVIAYAEALIFKSVSGERLRTNYRRPFPRSSVAWTFMLQEIDAWCRKCGELILVTSDEVPTHEDHRRELADNRTNGTFGRYRVTRHERVLDTIHYTPSHYSRLIQAIDCVLFICHRHWTVKQGDPRQLAKVRELYEIIQGHKDFQEMRPGPWPYRERSWQASTP